MKYISFAVFIFLIASLSNADDNKHPIIEENIVKNCTSVGNAPEGMRPLFCDIDGVKTKMTPTSKMKNILIEDFQNKISAPYINVVGGQIVKYKDSFWYMAPFIEGMQNLDQYLVQKVQEKSNQSQRITLKILEVIRLFYESNNLKLIEEPEPDFFENDKFIAFLNKKFEGQAPMFSSYVQVDFLTLDDIYKVAKKVRTNDPFIKKALSDYMALTIFEIVDVKDDIQNIGVRQNKDNPELNDIIYFDIDTPYFVSSIDGLSSLHQLVTDFYTINKDESGNYELARSYNINLYDEITYKSIVEQVQKILQTFYSGNVVSFSPDSNLPEIKINEEFLNTYINHYPNKSMAKIMAYNSAKDFEFMETVFKNAVENLDKIDEKTKWLDEENSPELKYLKNYVLEKIKTQPELFEYRVSKGYYPLQVKNKAQLKHANY